MHACMEAAGCFEVYMVSWWMLHFDASTPKRQQARSNWQGIGGLDLGPITRKYMNEHTKFQSTRVFLSWSCLKYPCLLFIVHFIFTYS